MRLRYVADDLSELARTRPHRPVARGQVDPGRVPKLGDAGEKCPVRMFLGVGLVLLGSKSRADQGARDVAPGIVRQLEGLPQDAPWDRNCPLAELLLLLFAQPVE